MNRQALKRITPQPVWSRLSSLYWWWRNRGRHRWARAASPRWQANRRKIASFQARHAGERCFILGNGPSLRRTDLSLLKDEITIGLNRIYLLYEETGFQTDYLVSVNDLVLEQCADEMAGLQLPKFITWRSRRFFADDPNTIFLDTDFTGEENFSGDLTGRLFEGYTVTYVALQLAFYMGCDPVILIGVDHSFQSKGKPNTTVVSAGDDPNHFAPNYFGKGFRWQLPDLQGSERAYWLAKEAYERAGRQVLDATVDGQLTIFSKIDYQALFPPKPE